MATEFGRLTAVFDADTRRLDSGLRGTASKVVALEGTLRGLSGGASSALGTLSGLASPIGIAAGAAVVAATAVSGLAVALWELVKSSARVGGELLDLSQKTAFTVETLSGLSIAAKTTGSDITNIAPSLVIFQKNMEAASDATSKQGRLFRVLSIDTRDNEKALRQAFTALGKMREGSQQTALAMQLFGRSGKDVLAIVKETNGNLDAAIKKYNQMGLIIGTGAATASDKFNDVLEETTLQLEAVTRSIGMELLPVATEALQTISAHLAANKDAWASWGTSIANLLRGTKVALESEVGQMIHRLSDLFVAIQPVTWAVKGLASLGESSAPVEDFFGPGGAARGGRKTLPGTPEFKAAQRRMIGTEFPGLSARGGKGGGGPDPAQTAQRIAQLQLDAVVTGLRAEQDANKRSLERRRQDFNAYATQYMVIENRRHKAVIDALDTEQRAAEQLKTGKAVALQEIQNRRTAENTAHEQNRNQVLDERARILDQIEKFIRNQERDLLGVTTATDQWDKAYQDLVDTLKEEGVELEENTRRRVQSNIEMLKEIDLVRQQIRVRQVLKSTRERFGTEAGRNRPSWIDLGGGSTVGGEPATTTRGRVVTAEEQAMRDRLAKIREQMKELSGELTSVFSQSISDGFNSGIKSGLQTLATGLLQIVQDVFLRRIAEGLADILTGLSSGGGGGIWSKLPAIILGAAGGIGGGGSGAAGGLGTTFAGAFATGGTIPMGQYGIVHDNERVFATPTGAHVIPASSSKGSRVENHYHYTINLPPDPRGSYSSPRSKRQLSETLIAALQASQS